MSRESSAKYYKKQRKDSKKKKYCERSQNLTIEERNKKQEHGSGQYKNLSNDKKQKLAEYTKIYYEMRKTTVTLLNKFSISSYKSKNVTVLGWPRF